MNVEKMIENLRENWEKEGYQVNSDPAAHAIGLMITLVMNPKNTDLENMRGEMEYLLADKVFYSGDQVNKFLMKKKFPEGFDPAVVRGFAAGLSQMLAYDFYQAVIRS